MKKIIPIVFMVMSSSVYAQNNTLHYAIKDLVSSRLFYEKCYQGKDLYKGEFATIDDENRFYITKIISSVDSRVDWFKRKAKWTNRGDAPAFEFTDKHVRKLSVNIGLLGAYITPDNPNSVIIRNGVDTIKSVMNKDNFEGLITAWGGCDSRLESYRRMEKEASKLFPKPW